MSPPSSDPSGLTKELKTRMFVVATLAAVAGMAGAAEHASPYDLRVDSGGADDGNLPTGTVVLVHDARPTVGDRAAYYSPGDDLAAGQVESVRETDDRRFYTLGSEGPGDDATIVEEEQVMGKLVAEAPHVGSPWTLPLSAQVAINVSLVGAYVGIGAYRARAVGPDR